MLRRRIGGGRLPAGWYEKTKAPNGVYILRYDGGKEHLVTREAWVTADNDKAVGVAVLTDNCKILIHPKSDTDQYVYSKNNGQVGGILSTDSDIVAKTDFKGSYNTGQLIGAHSSIDAQAAVYCAVTKFINGKNGYLGSAGEWYEASLNNTEINACFYTINKPSIPTDYIWTSTQNGIYEAWMISFYNKNIQSRSKQSKLSIRAITDL